MKTYISLLVIILGTQGILEAQLPKAGKWRGAIVFSSEEVPFNFEVAYPNGEIDPLVTIINGSDRASVVATVKDDSLYIPMFGFDITLKMKIGFENMEGVLLKHYSGRKYDFRAQYGLSRFDVSNDLKPIEVGSRWKMKLDVGKESEYFAVGLFNQTGSHLTGTIMTKVSDFRFFEGIVKGNEIEMSVFDGVHSFLLKGTFQDQKWSGELVMDDGYSQLWEAEMDENAELENPFEIIDLSEKNIKPDFDKLTVESEKLNPDDYAGKVLIIQIMGTWCSNSQDETKFLKKWHEENSDRAVEILAVNYEANYSVEYGLNRIETYKKRLGINYEMVLGGRLSKTLAAEAFPFMDKILAFPTLIFIDKRGYARYVHSYFTGPATGEYFSQFDDRFNAIVDELESE